MKRRGRRVGVGSAGTKDVAQLHYLAGFHTTRDLDIGPSLHHLQEAVDGFRKAGDVEGLVGSLSLSCTDATYAGIDTVR